MNFRFYSSLLRYKHQLLNIFGPMHALLQDVRFSLRLMRKRPGMTLLAIAALVLGIGLNLAIFSVMNAVLIRPLPIFEPDRVVWLNTKVNQTGAVLGTSYPDFLDWKAQAHSLEGIAAMRALSFTLTGNGSPERLKATAISASGFRVWGVRTILGRDFVEADDEPTANRVAILSYGLWQRKFGGDASVLQKTLILDDQPYSIIGVLQSTPISVLQYPDVWVANGPLLDQKAWERDTRLFFPVARLKPNPTHAQAQAELETIVSRLASQYPATSKDMGIRYIRVVDRLTPGGSKPFVLLLIASGALFLLAIVNVMTVFTGNTIERTQELTVRLALGSMRSSLLRQLFVQALILAGLGSALGLLLAKVSLVVFVRRFPGAVLRFQETTIDSSVILVTIAMALAVSFAAALPPAIYAFRLKISTEPQGLWSSSRSPKSRLLGRGALILFEVALASSLSLVSGLLIKSFNQVQNIDLGFNPRHIFSFQINPPATRYKEPSKLAAFYRLSAEKLKELPGLESVSGISGLPLTTQAEVNRLNVDTQSPLSGQPLLVEEEAVLPGFFRTMNLPVLAGRDFTEADHDDAPPVIIVDDMLATKLWPGQNPLGKRAQMTSRHGESRWLEVVGVVREIKHFGPEAKVRWMQVYVPQYQNPSPMLSFVVYTTLPESVIKASAERALHELDKDLPIESFQTMDAYLDMYLNGRKASMFLLSGFAAIGIALGIIGIYGVVANAVIQRRKEIAIRMAVGATAVRNVLLVTRLGLGATLGGILIGCGVVASLTRVLASILFGVSTLDPGVYMASAAIIAILAVAASVIPALRLARLNIQEILRQ